MFERKKINLTDFFNAKGQDEEMNDYFFALLEIINEPRFYLKDIGVSGKVMNDWIKYALIDETKEKGTWRKYTLKEAIWIKLIEELRFFGIPLKNIKNIKTSFYNFNQELISESNSYYERNAGKNEIYKSINESNKIVQKALSDEQSGKLLEYINPFSIIIAYTLSGSMNLVFIYSNENEGFFNIGDTPLFEEEAAQQKKEFEKIISTQSFVLINIKSLLAKFFNDEKESVDVNYYLGLMNSKEKKLIEQIRSSNYSKITITLQEGVIVLTRAQKKDNDDIIKQLARLMKRGDFVDLEISARDGKIIKVNQTELIK
jgi:DNA-binding transcriptional MerR regulator